MRVIHTVVFRLRHDEGSPAESAFLSDARRILSAIPAVNDFAVRRQVSSKSDARFPFSMTFDDQASYDAYNTHPDHVRFVETRWVPEVAAFQEYDFVDVTD